MPQLGPKSLKELKGVHPKLVEVVKLAIQLTPQDFTVLDGLRTVEEQERLFRSGASKTMASRHLTGHAVDLVPVVNGKPRWEWELIYPIANAVRKAAFELQVSLRWGGAWDVEFSKSQEAVEFLVSDYTRRIRAKGKDAFLDGPHFELDWEVYPK